jgi:Zn-dependent protease/CBS domain-containing protein
MFGKRFDLFTAFGITIRLDLSWIFIAVLVTWSLATGVFPAMLTSRAPVTYWVMGAAGAVGLFASILVHEMSHALVARRRGIPMRGITLFIFGGVAEMESEPPDATAELRMAAAGPAITLVIAATTYGLSFLSGPPALAAVLRYLATINLLLAVFNLVPAFPLDGGRIFRAYLWKRRGNLRSATRTAARVGAGFGLFLIVLGVWSVLMGNVIGGIWWALIGLFVRGAAQTSYQQVLLRKALEGEPVRRFMKADPIGVAPSATIAQLVDDYIYRYHYKLFPVVEDGRLAGCVTTRDVQRVPREDWSRRTVASISNGCTPDSTVGASSDAMEALTKMRRSGLSRLLVVDGDRLLGILSLKDLLDFFALRVELEG